MLNNLSEPYLDMESLSYWLKQGVFYVLSIVAPVLVAAFIGALFVNTFQVGFLFSVQPLEPKWKKINIFDPENFKKFFNLQAFMRLVFGLCKLLIIAIVTYLLIDRALPDISFLVRQNGQKIMVLLFTQGFYIGAAISVILILLGIADYIYQKWKFADDMKMTKQEVKDEHKQTEGDIHLKSKMRSLMQSFVQSRMKSNVPLSDVVIANPVHYAIAVKYDPDKMAAPMCVAKGARKMALAIKELAKQHKIPIVENPMLARSLYKAVDVGMYVPSNFYHAIAEVLAYVYRLNESIGRKIPRGVAGPGPQAGDEAPRGH